MSENIEILLDAAKRNAEAAPAFRANPYAPWVDSHTSEFLALIDRLKNDDGFGLFEDHLQHIGPHGSLTNLEELTKWLVARSTYVGAVQALSELREYLSASELQVFEVMILLSRWINDLEPYEFCNGIAIARPTLVPNRYLASMMREINSPSVVFPWPTVGAILYSRFNQHVIHHDSKGASGLDVRGFENLDRRPIRDMLDVGYCLSLVGAPEFGLQAVATCTVAGDELRFYRPCSGWSFLPFKPSKFQITITRKELDEADLILNKFLKLNGKFRDKLRVPMERLNNYGSGASLVDNAIDLRVCIDSLFGDGIGNEITFRVSLRAAQFLGIDDSSKEDIYKTIKKAYVAGSAAVHDGAVSEKQRNGLERAARLLQQALIKLIEDGQVDWERVELGFVKADVAE